MNTELYEIIRKVEERGRFYQQKKYIQHGRTTVYEHSVHVAEISLALAALLRIRVDKEALLKGALLHDYFLYDWHEPNKAHAMHGFRHPRTALFNAKRDYSLNKREENIILRHMFPLTFIPPTCKEAWIVCLVDKYCAIRETIQGRK